MDIRSSGIFGDTKSGGGLFRGLLAVNATAGGANTKVAGTPGDAIARRQTGVMFHDFIDNNDIIQYVVTNITSGTAVTSANSVNGAMLLTAATNNQGLGSVQFDDASVDNAAAFITPAANRVIVFEASVAINDVSQCDWFVGLGEVDTTFLTSAGALAANGADNHAGFHHLVADAGVPTLSSAGTALANVDSTQLGAGTNQAGHTLSGTMADATQHKLGVRIEGTSGVEFYLDDALVHTRTSSTIFDVTAPMTPTFCLIGGLASADMTVDYCLVAQSR
jgi:hypothetical protein